MPDYERWPSEQEAIESATVRNFKKDQRIAELEAENARLRGDMVQLVKDNAEVAAIYADYADIRTALAAARDAIRNAGRKIDVEMARTNPPGVALDNVSLDLGRAAAAADAALNPEADNG